MGFKGNRLEYKRPKKRFSQSVRKLYPCAKCGKKSRLPFKPKGTSPVYCNKCFKRID